MNSGKEKVVAHVGFYCDPRLKELAGDAADRMGKSLNDLVNLAVARFIRAPRGLEVVPKKRMGRPRKNGKDGD